MYVSVYVIRIYLYIYIKKTNFRDEKTKTKRNQNSEWVGERETPTPETELQVKQTNDKWTMPNGWVIYKKKATHIERGKRTIRVSPCDIITSVSPNVWPPAETSSIDLMGIAQTHICAKHTSIMHKIVSRLLQQCDVHLMK